MIKQDFNTDKLFKNWCKNCWHNVKGYGLTKTCIECICLTVQNANNIWVAESPKTWKKK